MSLKQAGQHNITLETNNFEKFAKDNKSAKELAELTGPSNASLYQVTLFGCDEFKMKPIIVVTTPKDIVGPFCSNLASQVASVLNSSHAFKRRVEHPVNILHNKIKNNVRLAYLSIFSKSSEAANKKFLSGFPVGSIPMVGLDEKLSIKSLGEGVADLRQLLADIANNVTELSENKVHTKAYAEHFNKATIIIHSSRTSTYNPNKDEHHINVLVYDKANDKYVEGKAFLDINLKALEKNIGIKMPCIPVYQTHVDNHVTYEIAGKLQKLPFPKDGTTTTLKMYHGTDRLFTEFNTKSYLGVGLGTGNGAGTHCATTFKGADAAARRKTFVHRNTQDSTGTYIKELSIKTNTSKVFEGDTQLKMMPASFQLSIAKYFPALYKRDSELHSLYCELCDQTSDKVEAMQFFNKLGVDVITNIEDDKQGNTAVILNDEIINIEKSYSCENGVYKEINKTNVNVPSGAKM